MASDRLLHRFSFTERLVHWVVGVTFVLLLATGLAFAHPSLFFLTSLLGGGPAARVLHPWVGAVFSVALLAMIGIWIRDMFLDTADRRWLKALPAYVTRDRGNVPPAGKYNAGQKLFFWSQLAFGVLFLGSGILLWFPSGWGASTLQWMRVIHYAMTLGGGVALVVHVYLGTLAYPGTARSMIDGKVTERWARHHHPAWKPEESPRT